jgi:hypothetical protein
MTLLELATYALATYRLTRLITRDTITAPLRDRIYNHLPPEESHLGYLFTCEWCMSIWTASLLFTSSIITPVTDAVATVLALSAVAGLLTAYEDK